MMAHEFERARVIAEAVDVAASALKAAIDSVTVSGDRIFVSAGAERLELSYVYNNAYAQDGSIMPGSGHWSVSIVGAVRKNRFAAALRAILPKRIL